MDDLVEGLIRMMNNAEGYIGPVNLGNPGEYSMLQLARMVIELTGSSSKIIHLPRPKDDPSQRRPDITLAKEKLGWQPTVGLREGLRRTIEHFAALNLDRFRRPTNHTAHKSSDL